MAIVGWLAFISPLASTMIAPAVQLVSDELHFESTVYRTFVASMFLLGYVVNLLVAPITFTPLKYEPGWQSHSCSAQRRIRTETSP